MLATPIMRAAGGQPGFWKRSIEELKRQAGIAIRMEALHTPKRAYPLIQFDEPGTPERCKILVDSKMLGGFSTAELIHQPGAAHVEKDGRIGSGKDAKDDGEIEEPSHVLFKGNISTELPPNRTDVYRSGFAAWRTRDRGTSIFGKLIWDIDPYMYLALRIKSDGRKYFVNLQTDSIVPTDLHQHLLPAHTPGQWETVHIPFSAFVRTNHGMVVEPQKEMLRQKVKSVGIGLTDRVPGPFEIRIADIYATNSKPTRVMKNSGFDLGPEELETESQRRERKRRSEPEKIMI